MEKAKIGFLFGQVPDRFNVDDSRDRQALLTLQTQRRGEERIPDLARITIAQQIVDDEPPETWRTAQRLLEAGFSREEVMNQLAMAFVGALTISREEPFRLEDEKFLKSLSSLPLPPPQEVRDLLESLVRQNHPVDPDDLEALALERLGRPGDPAAGALVDQASDRLMADEVLDYVNGDRIVHLGVLTAGITLTHRLDADEVKSGVLQAAADLSPFERHLELRLGTGELVETYGVRDSWRWLMPKGWAAEFAAGQLVAVTVAEDGLTQIAPVEVPPARDQDLIDRFRKTYDAAIAESGLPEYVKDIIYELLAQDPETFAEPRPPLDELCRAAGLEQRGASVAHIEELWENLELFHLWGRASDAFAFDKPRSEAAIRVVELAREANPSPADLKLALHDMADAEVADFVVEELASADRATAEDLEAAEAFATALSRAAGDGLPKAIAHWFAAVVAERAGEILVADAHLQVALSAGRDWAPLLERAAWYASDRGDAAGALNLLRRMPDPPALAVRTLSEYEHSPQPNLRRNDPCWCGSGRKFKQCHLAQPAGFPLPERVTWLCLKAASYMQYRGGEATDVIMALADSRAIHPSDPESVAEALQDPLVMDAALTEGGWFEAFLEDRSQLLPEDEAMLAESWVLVRRTLYEVERVVPGAGLTMRDLATGERLEVVERTFSAQAQVGWMVCARAVPDGEAHRFVGGIFAVRPGSEGRVLELCAEEDPYELCAYVAEMERPPRLTNREGEEMVSCTVQWQVRNPKAARRALNERYRVEDDGWVEIEELGEGDNIIRAQISLKGNKLTVNTLSEERMDRGLEFLQSAVDGVLLSDERNPIGADMEIHDDAEASEDPLAKVDPETLKQVMVEMQEMIEDRWMAEPVPALAGLTPREAAADPTRREMLERLLASFEEIAAPSQGFTFRVDRLRRELGME